MDIQSADLHAGPANTSVHAAADAPMPARAEQASRNLPLLDGQLIVQISQRDEHALGILYDRYGAHIYTIALRITQDQTLAETIVQVVFHTVWQSANSFQIGTNVPMWLIGMARQLIQAADKHNGAVAKDCEQKGRHDSP